MSDIHKVERSTSDLGTRPHQLGVQGWLLLKLVSKPSDDERLWPRVYETGEAALAEDALPNVVLHAKPGRTRLTLMTQTGAPISVVVDLVARLDDSGDNGPDFDPVQESISADFEPLFRPADRAVIPPHRGEAHL